MICKGLGQGSRCLDNLLIVSRAMIVMGSCEELGLGFTGLQDTMWAQNFTNPHTKEMFKSFLD